MGPDGSISDQYGWDDTIGEAGPLIGLSREEARAAAEKLISGEAA